MVSRRQCQFVIALAWFWAIATIDPATLIADENVGIGTTRPDSSAVLDISIEALTQPRGLLIPRLSLFQRDAITLPAPGLLIYNTTSGRVEINIGTRTNPRWVPFLVSGDSSGGDWALIGNAGLDPARHYLGTIDAVPLILKTNAIERIRITENGYIGIGTATPLGLLSVGPNSEFYVDANGQIHLRGTNTRILLQGNPGVAGDLLISGGNSSAPRWTKVLDSLSVNQLFTTNIFTQILQVDTLRTRSIRARIPFDSITTGVNEGQVLTVGYGSVLEPSGTGIIRANAFRGVGSTSDAVDLGTGEVSGVLPIEKGGTGLTSLGPAGSIAYSTGTALGFTSAGSPGQVLVSAGGGTPQWQTITASSINAWSLSGNTLTGSEFLGSTNAQPLIIQTNGTERMRVTTSGSVGIGTTSPSALLHVAGTGRFDGVLTADNNLVVNGNATLGDAAADVVTVVAGTVTLQNVPGNSTATDVLVRTVDGNVAYRSASSLLGASGWSLTGNSGTDPLVNFLGTTDNQPLVIRTNNTEQLRVTTSGSVGIGTTSPSALLHVAGTVTLQNVPGNSTATDVLVRTVDGNVAYRSADRKSVV